VRSESRSRALIVVLRACSNAYPTARIPLYLANVHLHSGVRGGDGDLLPSNARFFQIRSLLRRIELQCAKDAVRDGAVSSFILCGDFNMDGTMYELLVNGRADATQSRDDTYADYTHPLLPLVDAYASTPPIGPLTARLQSSHRSGRAACSTLSL